MKLYDALRTDSELRQEVQDLFDAERQQSLQRIESAKPEDLPALQAERLYLEANLNRRFFFFKEELNRGRPR